MKKRLQRIIWHVLILAWMVLIFLLSSQEAQTSSDLSGVVSRNIAQVFVRDFGEMQDAQQIQVIDNMQNIVRKGAHMFLYFVLGLLAMGTMNTYRIKTRLKVLVAFAIALLYAVSDEIHQLYVPGRACKVADVLIDATGAVLGILIFVGIGIFAARSADRKQGACGREDTNEK